MRFQPHVFLLHPELFEIESQAKEKHLRADIGLSAGEKTPEGKVGFEQGESPLNLNRTAHAQSNPARCADVALSSGAFFPERTVPLDFFGRIGVLRSAAEAAPRTVMATFTPVPCRGHRLPQCHFGLFSPA